MEIPSDGTDVIPSSVMFSEGVGRNNWSKAHLLSDNLAIFDFVSFSRAD